MGFCLLFNQRLIWVLFLLILSGCRKDKMPLAITATFQIKEVITMEELFPYDTYDTDSISTPEVLFVANQPADSTISYQWKIGTDSRVFARRSFELFFPPGTDSIQVSLTVQKKDANGLIAETKTATRSFYVRPSQVKGHFRGQFEGFAQQADVFIQQNHVNPQLYFSKGLLLTSSNKQFDSLYSNNDWIEKVILNRKIYFDWANVISDEINPIIRFPRGSIWLEKDYQTITIDMTVISVATGKRIPMKFKGKRVL